MNSRHDKPRRYRALVLTSCHFNRIHYLLLKLHQYWPQAPLDKALSRSLNYAIRNQAGPLTCSFQQLKNFFIEKDNSDGD
jgi:hypothetical protein